MVAERRNIINSEAALPRRVRLQPKSLYQIHDGALIAGVANGIATYFDINPKIVRAVFILIALLTKGVGAVLYVVLMVTMPVARTDEDFARARGVIPELRKA